MLLFLFLENYINLILTSRAIYDTMWFINSLNFFFFFTVKANKGGEMV